MKNHIPHTFAALAAFALIGASALKANNFDFHVDLNTTDLSNDPSSPFYLDFQLNEGTSATNSVVLSNFIFTGGTFTGTASALGNAAGSLGGTITLNDTPGSPFNEIYQGFSAGTTDIQFDVSVSQNAVGTTPDGFFAAILDSSSSFLPQIPTTAPDGVSLVALDIETDNTASDVHVYQNVIPVSSVPESANTAILFGTVAAMLLGFSRRIGEHLA